MSFIFLLASQPRTQVLKEGQLFSGYQIPYLHIIDVDPFQQCTYLALASSNTLDGDINGRHRPGICGVPSISAYHH
jgi:hypothetical protein